MLRRHPVAFSLLGLAGLTLAAVAGWLFYLNAQLSDIPRVDIGDEVDRAVRPEARGGGFSVLLVGVDNPSSSPGIRSALAATMTPR